MNSLDILRQANQGAAKLTSHHASEDSKNISVLEHDQLSHCGDLHPWKRFAGMKADVQTKANSVPPDAVASMI